MGEHAVVYGEPALVAAVDLRLEAHFEGIEGGGPAGPEAPVELRSEERGRALRLRWADVLGYAEAARERWETFAAAPGPVAYARLRGDDPAHLVKVALGEAAARLGERAPPGLRLEIASRIPIGSGFGSSAALAVAVTGGYLAWRGRPAPPDELEALALAVERRQHGTPSGVDGATALRGGMVWAERSEGGRLEFRALKDGAARLREFRAFDTGAPAESTGAVVAAVRERVAADPERCGELLREMGAATRRFRDALLEGGGPEGLGEPIRRFERGLEALGVVPEPARRIVRAVEARGGAAKISGAGALSAGSPDAPGAGSLLVQHPQPERIEGWGFLSRLTRWPLGFGAEGFRVESGVAPT